MWTFINLGIIILIIAIVIGIKIRLRWSNWLLALLSTIIIVVGSAFLLSGNYRIGNYPMMTLPLSPIIFITLWIAYVIGGWLGKQKTHT